MRLTYDNNYFNDRWQGIPVGGYTKMVTRMLEGIEVRTGVDAKEVLAKDPSVAFRVIWTGAVDEYFDYRLGPLEWRSMRFETEIIEGEANHQGVAVVNYTSHDEPYTRVIEHKHFQFGKGGTATTCRTP